MWTLANRTPFAAFSGFDRDKEGRSFWLVWAKATFRMRHQRTCLFERKQIDLFRAPVYRAEVGTSDLVADIDIGLPKVRPDVLFTGHAYARFRRREKKLSKSRLLSDSGPSPCPSSPP